MVGEVGGARVYTVRDHAKPPHLTHHHPSLPDHQHTGDFVLPHLSTAEGLFDI